MKIFSFLIRRTSLLHHQQLSRPLSRPPILPIFRIISPSSSHLLSSVDINRKFFGGDMGFSISEIKRKLHCGKMGTDAMKKEGSAADDTKKEVDVVAAAVGEDTKKNRWKTWVNFVLFGASIFLMEFFSERRELLPLVPLVPALVIAYMKGEIPGFSLYAWFKPDGFRVVFLLCAAIFSMLAIQEVRKTFSWVKSESDENFLKMHQQQIEIMKKIVTIVKKFKMLEEKLEAMKKLEEEKGSK